MMKKMLMVLGIVALTAVGVVGCEGDSNPCLETPNAPECMG